MPEYRVTAERLIRHVAVVEASDEDEAAQEYQDCNFLWDDEEDLDKTTILSVERKGK